MDYFEDHPPQSGERFQEDSPYFELVKPAFDTGDFCGKWKQTCIIYTYGKVPESRIMLLGLGKKEEISPFKVKISFAYALKTLQKLNIKEVSTFIDKKCNEDECMEISEFLSEAAYLSQYRHPSYKKNPPDHNKPIERINLILSGNADEEKVAKGIKHGILIGSSVNEVRDMVNRPSNYVTPTYLANYAIKLERDHSNITTKIYGKEDIMAMGMGGLISVSKGSKEEPKFIKCVYTPEDVKNYKTVALVGKGVTFDSGGISLKPSRGMWRMKDDMAGAALVLGLMKVVAELKLPIRILGLIPACENIPGAESFKPGDIITAYDGTTVEVYDTDAEGRLILMDALGYAVEEKSDVIVDMATLTGACTIALGRYVIGGLTNHQPVMDIMKNCGDYIYERVWQFPFMEEYKLPLKSLFADLKNYGGREGGSITAGAFLSHFVGKTPWIHLDVAAVSWFDTETSLIPEGASGIGVRLIAEFLKRLSLNTDPDVWQEEGQTLAGETFKENEVPTDNHNRLFQRKYFLS